MKAIDRRLRRLEDRFCPPVETEFSRRIQERIEAGWRRVSESDVQDGRVRDASAREHDDLSGMSVEQILLRGRARLATE